MSFDWGRRLSVAGKRPDDGRMHVYADELMA